MWTHIMTGGQPFVYRDDALCLELKPKLHKRFFDKNHQVTFTFLKDIRVTYIATHIYNTYDTFDIKRMVLENDKEKIEVEGNNIKGELARKIRNGHYKTLDIYIN